MIKGLGIDLVEIARIQKAYQRFGLKFASHFLTPVELLHMPQNPCAWLAGRFAAKEAASKALGVGFQNGVLMKNFLVIPDRLGRPVLSLQGAAHEFAYRMGIRSLHLSISHEKSVAAAVAVMEG